ncbi:cytochrome P450 [Paraburkholderia solisilvae]|uniref:Bifunctional cytochrome P450/NADPH--P450 reductase 2 n=1 Tax=Paraburkholderia solisilvae TaxID=624376 RepID=A0A6J5DD89_9BURK|nr:cytochrome P450 [Paraburkholderia solisilvae]CAB3752190.1 Bifunctional cytochrome P450/NADPH--P450 reductase 2 [Paraburkholderia solisilvae]
MSSTASGNTNQTDGARVRQLSDLPSPKGAMPLIGNLHQLSLRTFHTDLERWGRELGTPYVFRMFGKQIVVLGDTNHVQSISRERPHRYRRFKPVEAVLTEFGANGLFSAEGAAWEPQRRLVMQALSIPQIRAVYPTLAEITGRLHQRWLRAAREQRTVDMVEEMKRYSVDVTSALAFGEDPRTLERDGNVIQEHLKLVMPMLMSRTQAPFPYWHYVKLPQDRRLDRALVEIHRYVRQMMERARERMRDEPAETPRNLIEAMLAMRDQPASGITDDQVAANVLTMLLAGEDTTANSLAWSTLFIATEQPLQARLLNVARAVLGDAPVCTDYAKLKELDLFEAVSTEAGRFKPVAALSSYEPLEDVMMGDVRVPAGTFMFFLNRPPMHDPNNFVNPERFDPDRWLQARDPARGAHEPRAYLQFGAGPRVCPGRHLAGVEMRAALSMLVANFEVTLAVDPSEVEEINDFIMKPSSMPINLKIRSDAA